MDKVYSGWDALPKGYSSDVLTEGCLVLEGGAFRALYSAGVTDVLMENGINMSCVCGVSAGALNGANYASGQIGRSARINLRYRHDKNYVGVKPMLTEGGVIGFDYIFGDLEGVEPFDYEAFGKRRFVSTAERRVWSFGSFF
ncbi:MAG: patatin-like phospholipase family protein [Thermoguttaceae bacterium]|nr:patatin-like phospholipase family protein [Thermoguttaceae bacterium]